MVQLNQVRILSRKLLKAKGVPIFLTIGYVYTPRFYGSVAKLVVRKGLKIPRSKFRVSSNLIRPIDNKVVSALNQKTYLYRSMMEQVDM